MIRKTLPAVFSLLLAALSASAVLAQRPEPNYDESAVPEYTLPDPLVRADGERVTDSTAWFETRRPEVLRLFTEQVYGEAPGRPEHTSYRTFESGSAFDGLAERKQVRITFRQGGRELAVDVLIYMPADREGPVPAFLGLNFAGNHTVSDDPAIRLNTNWMRDRPGVEDHRATEASRGLSSSRWAIEKILRRGYALATAYYGDIDPDYDDGFRNGVHGLFRGPGDPPPDSTEWGSISAWAWGLSRILDCLETDEDIDHGRVAVIGHSRLGKTALWAGARDERFGLVISNNSGCGGAALSRRRFGETVGVINESFPHWFCDNFNRYNDSEDDLPVDQHMLIALMAPRPVYVASAEDDRWADPRGEFLAVRHADPVFRLATGEGLPVNSMPPVDEPAIGRLSYHIRSGGHDVTDFDWEQYLAAADRYMK